MQSFTNWTFCFLKSNFIFFRVLLLKNAKVRVQRNAFPALSIQVHGLQNNRVVLE